MNLSKKQLSIGILVFVAAAAAVLLGVFSVDQNAPEEPDNGDDTQIQSISWNENTIEDQAGNVLVSIDDVPSSIQVSEEAEFGASGSFTGATLSPDQEWIAFTTGGAAHDGGWMYEIETEEISPVAFQYGGGVETIEWSPDSQFMAFMIGTPAPSEHILIVDRGDIEGYVSEIGHQIQVDEQAGMNPPYAYEFIRWESPHTLCYSFENGEEQCVEAEDVMAEGGDNQNGDDEPIQGERDVLLYYYNPDEDTDDQGNVMCSDEGLVPVDRTITNIQTPISSTVRLLLEGDLTQAEQNQGITTEFPLEGFELEGVNLEDGVATLEFSDPQNRSSGGSCRATLLWAQISETVLQFDEVDEVNFIPEDIFQP